MKHIKKIAALFLFFGLVAGLFGTVRVAAEDKTPAAPKITVKTFSKKTGVKITIKKNANAEAYEVTISGTPANSDACSMFKYKAKDGNVYMGTSYTIPVYQDGKAKRKLVIRDLQPGKYQVYVKAYCYINGTKTYSVSSKVKSFTLKEAATKGNASSYNFSSVKKGDIIKFGAYEQDLDYTNGKEPIEWIVLSKATDSLLVMSRYALDRLPVNKNYTKGTWETSTLRTWLNGAFIKSAFNKTEQKMLINTTVENENNSIYKTSGGNATKDKIFILSQADVAKSEYGYSDKFDSSDTKRRCSFAWYKNKKGSGNAKTSEGMASCWWWTRTPGLSAYSNCIVDSTGIVISNGRDNNKISENNDDYGGVRPVMYISVKS